MKKFLSLILAVTLLASVLLIPINAAALRWTNTSAVIIAHGYFDGNADCLIFIDGATNDTQVTNVDVKLERKVGSSWIHVAHWDDLSCGQYFRFNETVENVSKYYIYRLSFTAEVVCNDVSEYLDMHKDVDYCTNTAA